MPRNEILKVAPEKGLTAGNNDDRDPEILCLAEKRSVELSLLNWRCTDNRRVGRLPVKRRWDRGQSLPEVLPLRLITYLLS